MKLELSERFLVEELVFRSIEQKKIEIERPFIVERLTGDASTRRYYRIQNDGKSFVVCLGDPVLKGKVESSFIAVQRVLQENKVRVPIIYDYDLPRGYLLQEDLGDSTFLSEVSMSNDKACEYALYERALDALIKMHQVDVEKYKSEEFYSMSFDFKKFSQEVDFSVKNFIGNYLSEELSDHDSNIIKKDFYNICEKLSKPKKVFTHRDYHSRNLMMKNGEMVIIDIQDARMGLPQYDLVSLLEDCYYDICQENRDKCKKFYFENFIKLNKHQSDLNEYYYYYDLMAIQRIFKAIGSFSYIYKTRNDARYVKYIGYGFEKLRNFLFRYPEYNQLRILLSQLYYGN